jgi:ferredoxin
MGRSKRFYDALVRIWPLGKVANWLGGRPLIGPLLRPLFSSEENETIVLPVHQAVRGTESVVLPYALLAPLVERASARFIMNDCICRRGESCRTYPQDLGCVFLGPGAAEINPDLGHLADVEECMQHIQHATELGLVPQIIHAAFDAWMLDIPYRRMLAICLCCDCCCTIHQGLRMGPPVFWDTVVRLPGLTVNVGPECIACGRCTEVCPVGAIGLTNGRAEVSERCKGCGRCARQCPAGAITLTATDDVLERLLARIEQRTSISGE